MRFRKFLYLALLALKDIEHRANIEAELLGLTRLAPAVGPEAVLGIEINPYPYKRSHLVALRSTKISASDPPSTWWSGER
jgi:hypothetical protein